MLAAITWNGFWNVADNIIDRYYFRDFIMTLTVRVIQYESVILKMFVEQDQNLPSPAILQSYTIVEKFARDEKYLIWACIATSLKLKLFLKWAYTVISHWRFTLN